MSGYPQDAFTLVSADSLDFVHGHARVYCKCKKSGNHCGPGCACLSCCNVPASITQEVMEIEVTETVNQESDITDSDFEDVDDRLANGAAEHKVSAKQNYYRLTSEISRVFSRSSLQYTPPIPSIVMLV